MKRDMPSPRGTRGARPPVIFAFGALWATTATLAVLGPSRDSLLPSLLSYTVGFGALAYLWQRHRSVLDDPRVLIGSALLLRLTIFPSLPDLSDDIYRYVWDGWLGISGVNPFRFVPAAAELVRFQDSDLFPALNSSSYHSIYPPLSQLVFLVGGAAYQAVGLAAAVYAIKAVFLVFEVTGTIFLIQATRAMGLRPSSVALYALNPLVLVTLTAGGHSESGLVLGLGMMAYAAATNRTRLAWMGLLIAVATKGIPLLLAPLLLRRQSLERGPFAALLSAAPAAILGLILLVPYYFPGLFQAIGSSADLYVRLFEFNAGLYFLIKEIGLWMTGADWGKTIGPALRMVFLASAVFIWIRWPVARIDGLMRGSLALIGLYLVTATTVHPWYLAWGLVLVPMTPLARAAWLWASWAAFLTYFVYVGVPQGPPSSVFWIGVAALLVWEWERPIKARLLRLAGRRKARQVERDLVGSRILDLGAGEGYVGLALEHDERRVFLADVGNAFRVDLPGVVFDGTRLPFRDGSVDSVLLSLVLHHAANPERLVVEAIRVARHRVVVTESTYRWGWERRLLEIADRLANRTRAMAESGWMDEPLRFRTADAWAATFEALGVQVVRLGRVNLVGHRHFVFVLRGADSADLEGVSPAV